MDAVEPLLEETRALSAAVGALSFGPPVHCVYNPLDYAWEPHERYLRAYGGGRGRVVFLGMNPGPWGMAQTGVPFGEVAAVRDWMGIEAAVRRPNPEHPKRPILGFACARSEVSGRRLWGLFAQRYASAEAFFAGHFVANYCPLVFMAESGGNITPDKLPPAAAAPLQAACDRYLARLVEHLQPRWLVGVGGFAASCLRRVVGGAIPVGLVLHPSPASPAANRDWAGAATRQLVEQGIWNA